MRRSVSKLIIFLILLLVLPAILVALPRCRGAAETVSEREVNQLIESLGSGCFEIRETASKRLMELEEAIPTLQKARNSADPEVRHRARDILRALSRKRAQRWLARAKVLSEAGRIIETADRVAYWGKGDSTGESWEILTRFADRLAISTTPLSSPGGSWMNPALPKGDFHQYVDKVHPKEIAAPMIDRDTGGDEVILNQQAQVGHNLLIKMGGSFLLRGEEITLKSDDPMTEVAAILHRGIIAASGDVRVFNAAYSLIITGGNFETNGVRSSIIVCDGDIKVRGAPEGCLIVARGKVTCGSGKPAFCMIRSGRSLLLPDSMWPDGKTIALKEGVADPLAFVKFFELGDVGITAEDFTRRGKSDPDSVLLKDVRKESPFAGRLRGGDVILAIDERKTPTTESFHRTLRRTLAKGGPTMTFTVRRADKTFDISIPVKD